MNINNETITMLKKLDWQQDFLEGFYSVIIPKNVLVINAGNPPELLYSLTYLDFSTIHRINEGKDIYIELVYQHKGVEEHCLTLNIYIAEGPDDIGTIVFSDNYVDFNSVDFLELFEASDYEEYKKEVQYE